MISNELFGFLKTHFPVHTGEVGVALDLLIYSLNEAAEALTDKGNELSKNKEYDKAIEYMQKARELDDISKEYQCHLDTFQLDDVAQISEDEKLEGIEKKYPNYSEYEVDYTVVHTLHENYIYKRPYAFELKGRKERTTEWKKMLLETCNILADINPTIITEFPNNPKLNGRKSKYFLTGNPGSMRAPRKLRKLNMYVETNFSANDIRNLIIKMLNQYKIPLSEYRIYLRADYTELHKKAADTGNQEDFSLQETEIEDQQVKPVNDFTDLCIRNISEYLQKPLNRLSKARYATPDQKTKVVCLISSERDTGRHIYYWFGLRMKQKEFLDNVQEAYVALGCGSEKLILFVPFSQFCEWLDYVSTTGSGENFSHWHVVVIKEQEKLFLRLKTGVPNVNITEHVIIEDI